MPKRKYSSNNGKVRRINSLESTEKADHVEAVFIPNSENFGESDCNDDNDLDSSSDENKVSIDNEGNIDPHVIHPVQSYQKVAENYNARQKMLEEDHVY